MFFFAYKISHLEDELNKKIEDHNILDCEIEEKKACADYLEDELVKVF